MSDDVNSDDDSVGDGPAESDSLYGTGAASLLAQACGFPYKKASLETADFGDPNWGLRTGPETGRWRVEHETWNKEKSRSVKHRPVSGPTLTTMAVEDQTGCCECYRCDRVVLPNTVEGRALTSHAELEQIRSMLDASRRVMPGWYRCFLGGDLELTSLPQKKARQLERDLKDKFPHLSFFLETKVHCTAWEGKENDDSRCAPYNTRFVQHVLYIRAGGSAAPPKGGSEWYEETLCPRSITSGDALLREYLLQAPTPLGMYVA